MPDLWTEKYKLTHRIEGVVNGLEAEIAEALEGSLSKVSGKIIELELKAEKAKSLLRKKKYLDRQKQQIEKVLHETYKDIGSAIEGKAQDLASATPKILDKTLKASGITVKLGMPFLDKKTVSAWFESAQIDGLFYNEWLKKLEQSTAARVIKEAREGMILSEGVKKVGKRIQEALGTGRHGAAGMAHNALFQAWNWSERRYYNENKSKIKALRFVAELDRQTTPLCISLSGQVFKVEDAPQPPLHWRCRSSLAPIFKWDTAYTVGTVPTRLDTEPRIVRHRDGTTSTKYEAIRVKFVPADTTHSQWVTGLVNSTNPKDVAFAREMLGPTRFKLVNSGKLSVDKFYYHGKLRTIKELEALI
jgi:SPP1 gp7 family putative phage head morphogenesis protein